MTFHLRVVVPSYIFYGIPHGDDGKLFKLKVWCYIHRKNVGIYYSYRGTASCRKTTGCERTTSQIDETVEENQAVLDSEGNRKTVKKTGQLNSTHRLKSGNKRQKNTSQKVQKSYIRAPSKPVSQSDNFDQRLELPNISTDIFTNVST